jgi:Ca2+-binding EF-hand superfamily protein
MESRIAVFFKGILSRAIRSNMRTFMLLDKPNANGQVEWNEWYEDFIRRHSATDPSSRQFKEKIAAAKAAWSEAARANPEHLNIDEFLSFTHSEFSHPLILQDADEFVAILDDGPKDGLLSLDEYLARVDGEERRVRESTFDLIDQNGDRLLSRNELLPTFDPKSEAWARRESERLFLRFDVNQDEAIDKDEFSSDLVQAVLPENLFHSIF